MSEEFNELIKLLREATPPIKLEWSKDLELGIPEIDRQHRQLVDLMNELYSARYVQDNDAIRDVLCRVISTVRSHFALEERLMKLSGYSEEEYLSHKASHGAFLHTFADYLSEHDVGHDVAAKLQQALFRWMIHHNKEDVRYK